NIRRLLPQRSATARATNTATNPHPIGETEAATRAQARKMGLAFVASEIHDKNLTHEINFQGSVNVIEAALAQRVRRVVVSSSIAAYGIHPEEGTRLLDEDRFPRGNADKYYFYDSAEVEHFAEWTLRRQDVARGMAILLLRFPWVYGPHFNNAGISMMTRPLAQMARGSGRFQLLHEDDMATAFHIAVKSDLSGPYNVGPDGVTTVRDMARVHGQQLTEVPLPVARVAADVLFRLRLSPASSHWAIPEEPCISSARFRAATGWQPRLTTHEVVHVMLLQRGRPILCSGGELRRHEVAEAVLSPVTERLRQWCTLESARGSAQLEMAELEALLSQVVHAFIDGPAGDIHLEVHAANDAEAPTVVLVAPLGGHARALAPRIAELLRARRHVVAVDRPGHGLSHGRRGDAPRRLLDVAIKGAESYARRQFGTDVVVLDASMDGLARGESNGCRASVRSTARALGWRRAALKHLAAVAPLAPVPTRWIAAPPILARYPGARAQFSDPANDALGCLYVTARTAADALDEAWSRSAAGAPDVQRDHERDGLIRLPRPTVRR
ncbi:MAG: NAD-dependent epimerase/dehydratase family protein, partial [Solirubrobacteraceae bacterium]